MVGVTVLKAEVCGGDGIEPLKRQNELGEGN
jgi:hypothetical protein